MSRRACRTSARAETRAARLRRDLCRVPAGRRGRAGRRAARNAACRSARSTARSQQHPRLAEADRRGPARGGLRGRLGDQQLARRSAAASARRTGSARATASSSSGPRHGHDRLGREVHHRHGVGAGLGEADPPARGARAIGRHHRRRARPGLAAAEQLRRKGYQIHVYDRYDRVGGLLIYGIPNFKLEKDVVRAARSGSAEGGITFHLNIEIGRDVTLGRAAPAPRRGADRDRRLQGARHAGAGLGPGRHRAGDDVSHRQQPQGPRRQGAGVRQRQARRRRQGRGRDRRRRHGDGLRAHRRAPGRQVGEVPLPPRPRKHARLDARGEARRGRRRRVRLARRRPRASTARGTVSTAIARRMRLGRARRHRPRRPGESRTRRSACPPISSSRRWASTPSTLPALFRAPELAVTDWGTVKIDHRTLMTEPRRRVRRRRHRARRLARRLGDQRRPRRRGQHRPLHPGAAAIAAATAGSAAAAE